MGLYLMHVLDPNGRTWLDPVLAPVERFTYRAMGVDPRKEHDWKQYTLAMLLFSLWAACSPMRSCVCNIFCP
jgi:K+-transporting ATPase, A chain